MDSPFHIQWHMTNVCNLRCTHCYQEEFSEGRELDRKGLEAVADHLMAFLEARGRRASIHLTGGEPLLKKELFLLLDLLDRSPRVSELGVITNGLLLNREVLKRLSQFSKLRKIKLSLDGAVEETNDSIRGGKTFRSVLHQVQLIQDGFQFEIVFMFTVMRRNFREVPAFLNLSQELGVSGFIIERFIPLGRGRMRMNEVLTKEEWREMVGMLLDLFSIEEDDSLLPYQAFQVSLGEGEPELLGAPCIVGKDGLCVMPDGVVFPCRRLPLPAGNLLQHPLEEIWEGSDLLNTLRRKASLRGRCGGCPLEDCRGCRSLAFALTGDPLAEDPCCRVTPQLRGHMGSKGLEDSPSKTLNGGH